MNNILKSQAFEYSAISMAYHEASHAVCGLHNFIQVKAVHIMTEKQDSGNTVYETIDPDTVEDQLLVKISILYEVQMLYAGLVGEKIYYKDICGSDKFPMHLRIGSSDDITAAGKLISKYNLANSGKSRSLLKKQVQSDVSKVLKNYWDDVKLVSHALYKNKKLDHKELKFILTKKSNNKEFWKSRFKMITALYAPKNVDDRLFRGIYLSNQIIII